jgi:hypothetical protein
MNTWRPMTALMVVGLIVGFAPGCGGGKSADETLFVDTPPESGALTGEWRPSWKAVPSGEEPQLTLSEKNIFSAKSLVVEENGKVSVFSGLGRWELQKDSSWKVVLILPNGFGYGLTVKRSTGGLILERVYPDPDGPNRITLSRRPSQP